MSVFARGRNLRHKITFPNSYPVAGASGGAIRRPCFRIPTKFVVRLPCQRSYAPFLVNFRLLREVDGSRTNRSPSLVLPLHPPLSHRAASPSLSIRKASNTDIWLLTTQESIPALVSLAYFTIAANSLDCLSTTEMSLSSKDAILESRGLMGFPSASFGIVETLIFWVVSISPNDSTSSSSRFRISKLSIGVGRRLPKA